MRRVIAGTLLAAPLAIGVVLAVVLAQAGEKRMLQLGIALPAAVLLGGALLTALLALPALVTRARRRRLARNEALADEAAAAVRRREQEQHRRFLARLDHELKNPVMAIRAQAAAAGEGEQWRIVDAQATKLGTLVQDLRKLAELETRELEREQVDLETLLRDSIEAIGHQHPDAATRFELTVTRVPWPVPPITADLDLLALAVDNVLGNAAKYSSEGAIEVRLRESDGWAVIEVADNGRGIPAEDLPQVFDELARAGNARDVPGSGLGLTLVSTVLRRHGGDVQLRSLADAGTIVTLRLPLDAQPR